MSTIDRRQFMARVVGGTGALCAAMSPADRSAGALATQSNKAAKKPFIVDVHVHMRDPALGSTRNAFTDVLFKPFQAVYDGNGNRLPNPKKYSYLPEEIIQRMNEGGIDVSFVMIGGTSRIRQAAPTRYEFLAEQVQRYPGRLVGMPIYDPLEHQWRGPEFVDSCSKLDFKAIKLLPVSGDYDPYDERLWPFYEKAIERDIVIVFHTGWSPYPFAPIHWGSFSEIHGLDQVAIRYPNLKIHLAHAGGPATWKEAVLVTAKHDNLSLDFSSWCAYPPQQLIALLGLARDVGGIDKVMFGSEHSICDPGVFVNEIRNINLWADRLYYTRFTDEEIAKILGLNAARKWKLSTTPRI